MKRSFSISTMLIILCTILIICSMPSFAQTSYRDATGGFLKEATLVSSAAYTVSGDIGTPIDVGAYNAAVLHVNVTAISGSGAQVIVTFQSCPDTTKANCSDHTATSALSATGNTLVKLSNFGRYVFVKYAISGSSPSVTFSVKAAFKPQT